MSNTGGAITGGAITPKTEVNAKTPRGKGPVKYTKNFTGHGA